MVYQLTNESQHTNRLAQHEQHHRSLFSIEPNDKMKMKVCRASVGTLAFITQSINFMEAALLQAVVPGGGDGAQGLGDEATRADTEVFPSYSLTDVDGVVHTCTVRRGVAFGPVHGPPPSVRRWRAT